MERAKILTDARNGFLPARLWNCYPEVGDLATRLLFPDPGSRPSAAQALEHPALTARNLFEPGGLSGDSSQGVSASSSAATSRDGSTVLRAAAAARGPSSGASGNALDLAEASVWCHLCCRLGPEEMPSSPPRQVLETALHLGVEGEAAPRQKATASEPVVRRVVYANGKVVDASATPGEAGITERDLEEFGIDAAAAKDVLQSCAAIEIIEEPSGE